jgi:hypothetical protein
MKYAVGMCSGAMIYIPSFIKTGSGIQKLMGGGGYSGTQTAWRSHKPASGSGLRKENGRGKEERM